MDSLDELRELLLSDPSVGLILRAMESGISPIYRKHKAMHPKLTSYYSCGISWRNGTLLRHYEDIPRKTNTLQLVVPSSLRVEVLQELHAEVIRGHLGEEKTLGRLRKR